MSIASDMLKVGIDALHNLSSVTVTFRGKSVSALVNVNITPESQRGNPYSSSDIFESVSIIQIRQVDVSGQPKPNEKFTDESGMVHTVVHSSAINGNWSCKCSVE